jgi:hypothetical protein
VVDVARAFEHTQPDFEDTMPLSNRFETPVEAPAESGQTNLPAAPTQAPDPAANQPTSTPPGGGMWSWDPANPSAVAGGWVNLDAPKEN